MKRFLTIFFLLAGSLVYAATNIDSSCKYAWSGSTGWINFGCEKCNVQVLDDKIIGYAWSQNYGWINLHPTSTNVGIFNDGQGNLSGYAWGENLGWIDFSNAKIDSNTGNFTGYALILIYSSSTDEMRKIVFQGNNFCLKTSWQSSNQSNQQDQTSGTQSGGGYFLAGHHEEFRGDVDQNILQYILNLFSLNLFSKLTKDTDKEKITEEIKTLKYPIRERIYISEEKLPSSIKETSTILEKVVKEKIEFPLTGILKITYTLKDLDLILFNVFKIEEEDKLISTYIESKNFEDKDKLLESLNVQIIILVALSIIILYVVFAFL